MSLQISLDAYVFMPSPIADLCWLLSCRDQELRLFVSLATNHNGPARPFRRRQDGRGRDRCNGRPSETHPQAYDDCGSPRITDKVAAGVKAQAVAASGIPSGQKDRVVAGKVLRVVKRRVRANKRRLSRR